MGGSNSSHKCYVSASDCIGWPPQNCPRLISDAMKTKTISRIMTKWLLFTLHHISKRKLFFRLNAKMTILDFFRPFTQWNPHKPLRPIKPLFYLLIRSKLLPISFRANKVIDVLLCHLCFLNNFCVLQVKTHVPSLQRKSLHTVWRQIGRSYCWKHTVKTWNA